MKNIILLVFIIMTKFSYGQNLIFTNQNLKTFLLNENCVDTNGDEFGDSTLDLNNDNEIQITEANNVENLVISINYIISSIYDLHQFTNLKRLTVYGGIGLIEISNLNLDSLLHIRISDHNSITSINLFDLPNLNSIIIEGLTGLNSLNIQNGSYADEYFSLFYTYFNSACVDSITAEYNLVAQHILNGEIPVTNCSLDINKQLKIVPIIVYPNPAMSEIRVITDLKISKTIIYNIIGEIVYESYLPSKILNIESLNKGVYVLILETINGEKHKQKIIKK